MDPKMPHGMKLMRTCLGSFTLSTKSKRSQNSHVNAYLTETALAMRGLFSLIGNDESVLSDKKGTLDTATRRRTHAQSILHAGAPTTGFGEDTRPYFEKKARDARRESREVEAEIVALKATIFAKETSVQALSGAVLQIAKQGVAIVRGDLAACPPGRLVGRETLKNVIWQARNQSMHWEENAFHQSVIACFANLQLDFGNEFQLPTATPRSLAKQVLQALGWNTYESYEHDLVSLLG